MPYKLDWYVEGQVVYVRFEGELMVDEFREFMRKLFEYFDQSPVPLVHVISDNRWIKRTLSLREIMGVVQKPHERVGWYLEVNSSISSVRLIANLVTQMLKIRSRSFTTLEEAIAFLKSQDQHIAWDKADASVIADG